VVQQLKMRAALVDFSAKDAKPAPAAASGNEIFVLKQHSSSSNSCTSCKSKSSLAAVPPLAAHSTHPSHGENVKGPHPQGELDLKGKWG
jgi:hypothetical protein